MKKHGFTLIELLAVIVILAIIALIAVPIVLNSIGNTRVSAAKRSAENYIDAVELYLARSELDTNKVTLERNNKYNLNQQTIIGEKTYPKINDLVEISGSKPTGTEDYVQLNSKGKIIDAQLTMVGYEVEIKDGKIVSATKGDPIEVENITLNITEQTMESGSTFKIVPTFEPSNASNQEIIYESSDESIVTVDNLGNVTAVGPGTAKITATSKDKPTIKVECNITVVVSATGLTIKSYSSDVTIGYPSQLTGVIEPSNATTNALTWKSSNADIASVDSNGLVTGIKLGEVTITATTVNGIEASINLTIKLPSVISFQSDYWDTIVINARAGNMSAYELGETKVMDMGALGMQKIRVINNTIPDECNQEGFSQTACGFVIEFVDTIELHNMNSTATSTGGWPASEMRAYLNNTIYKSLPSIIKDSILDTYVVTGYTGNVVSSQSENFVSTDKLYLLSTEEVLGTTMADTSKGLTRQTDYYLIGNGGQGSTNRFARKEGKSEFWWLRSILDVDKFMSLDSRGMFAVITAENELGVSPSFRIA